MTTQSIKGYFRSHYPIIDLEIDNRKTSLILDTGFNGEIMLPKRIIEVLDLAQIGFMEYRTADGRKNITQLYTTPIKIMNEVMNVPVVATDSNFSLAGIKLFNNCKIILEENKNIVEISEPN
tara:strand:+ start:77 stop:442 length:366 start_codon:yes stop_codon:yes gene_type:complete